MKKEYDLIFVTEWLLSFFICKKAGVGGIKFRKKKKKSSQEELAVQSEVLVISYNLIRPDPRAR